MGRPEQAAFFNLGSEWSDGAATDSSLSRQEEAPFWHLAQLSQAGLGSSPII